MNACVIPFLKSFDLHFTFGERRAVVAWCAFRGLAWSVHATQSATGYMVLGIVTPGRTAVGDEPAPAWLVRKMSAGLLLTDAATDSATGLYPSILDVLAAVTKVEGAEAANDNPSGQMCQVPHAAAITRPADGSTASQRSGSP